MAQTLVLVIGECSWNFNLHRAECSWSNFFHHHWQPSGVHCRMKASSMLSHSVQSFATSAQFFILPRCLWISSAQRFWVCLYFVSLGRISTLWGHAPNCRSCEPRAQPISTFCFMMVVKSSGSLDFFFTVLLDIWSRHLMFSVFLSMAVRDALSFSSHLLTNSSSFPAISVDR